MRRPDLRRALAATAATIAVTAAALLVPGTAGAFSARVVNASDTAASKTVFTCADLFAGYQRTRAYFEYSLTEAAGATVATDAASSANTGTYAGSNAKDAAAPQACPSDARSGWSLDGTSSTITTRTSSTFDGTTVVPFTIAVWFRTTVASGKLIGFETSQTGMTTDHWDKHLYINDFGALVYGIFSNGTLTLVTPSAVTDGAWHQAVATTSAAGSVLYLDGAAVASDASMTLSQGYTGWWRLGAGRLTNWPDESTNPDTGYFTGSLRFAAALKYAMTAKAVQSSYRIGLPR